jgi:hypothetical protein
LFGFFLDFTSPYTTGATPFLSRKICECIPDFFKILETSFAHSSIPWLLADTLG